MVRNWTLIGNFNWTFSELCLLIYIYIYIDGVPLKLLFFLTNDSLLLKKFDVKLL